MNGEPALDDMHQLRRNGARATILDATRRVIARVGIAELTLSLVAAETGFGPSTVFGHFRNKDELLLAILAEDLGTVAASMRDSLPPAAVPELEPSSDFSAVQEEDLTAESDESGSASLELISATAGVAQNVVPLRLDSQAAWRPEVIGSGTEVAIPERTRPDAWLERRLRVFEHTLADVEQRLKDTEASSSRSVSLADHGIKTLFDRLEQFERQQIEAKEALARRMEETEQRQRGATAEMRAAMNDAAVRIEILEAARRNEDSAVFGKRASEVPNSAPGEQANAAPEPPPAGSDPEAYRAIVQRAATAAAALARIETPASSTASRWEALASRRVRLTRRHYIFGGAAALLAFIIGALAAFYIGQARGHDMAIASQVKAVRPTIGTGHIAQVPSIKAPKPVVRRATPDRVVMLAQAGNPLAELMLGMRYLQGEGTAPDQPKAAQWIQRAAQQHEPLAQYWLGTLYERGDGLSPDSAEAVRWYEGAAAQGNRKAMHALGVAYAQGTGTQKDYSAAARWFSKAAELGLVNSQFNLGVLYERGLGVPQSLLDAYKWYAIAAAKGDQESRARIETLRTQLSADDLVAAQRAAAAFVPAKLEARANELPTPAALSATAANL